MKTREQNLFLSALNKRTKRFARQLAWKLVNCPPGCYGCVSIYVAERIMKILMINKRPFIARKSFDAFFNYPQSETVVMEKSDET